MLIFVIRASVYVSAQVAGRGHEMIRPAVRR